MLPPVSKFERDEKALKRVGPGIRHLRSVTVVEQADGVEEQDPALTGLDRKEIRGVVAGPVALLRSRAVGRSAKPMKLASNRFLGAFDFRRGQNWGDLDNNITAGRLAVAGGVIGVCGLIGAIGALPSLFRVLLVGVFALAAPGLLILSWYAGKIPLPAMTALVPALSLAATLLTVTLPLMAGYFEPRVFLLGLAGTCVVGALARCAYLARRVAVPS